MPGTRLCITIIIIIIIMSLVSTYKTKNSRHYNNPQSQIMHVSRRTEINHTGRNTHQLLLCNSDITNTTPSRCQCVKTSRWFPAVDFQLVLTATIKAQCIRMKRHRPTPIKHSQHVSDTHPLQNHQVRLDRLT